MSQHDSLRGEKLAATTIVIGWTALVMVCGTMPAARLWGLNHLSFLPPAMWWALAATTVLVTAFIWYAPSALIDLARGRLVGAGLFLAFLVAMCLVRAATPLLGDGYLRADEAARRAPEFFVVTDLLPAWITSTIKQRTALGNILTGQETVAFLSIVSGMFVAAGAWLFGPRVLEGQGDSARPARKSALPPSSLVWLLSTGGAQLYFGYIELYALGAAFLTLFTIAVLAHERGTISWIWPVILWAGAFWSHLSAIAWAPLMVWAIASRGHSGGRIWRTLIATGVLAVSIAGIALLREPESPSIWSRYLLPLTGDGYTVLDWRHLGDIFNTGLLLFPVGLVLLISTQPQWRTWRKSTIILLALPVLAFLLFLKVDLGFPRDWDLLALISTPVVTWLAVVMARQSQSWPWPRIAAALFVAVSATGTWALLNSSEQASSTRFATLVELDAHVGSSGHEILARHWREQGDWRRAVDELGRAMAAGPTARIAIQRGIGWSVLGSSDSALAAFQVAIALEPDSPDGHFGVGQSLWALGRALESLPYLRRAVALDSSRADYHYHLGMTLRDLGQVEAIAQLRAAARLAPRQPAYAHVLGVTTAESGDTGAAVRDLTQLVTTIPEYAPAYVDLGWMLFRTNRHEETRRVLNAYGDRIPIEDWDPAMRILADSLNAPGGHPQ